MTGNLILRSIAAGLNLLFGFGIAIALKRRRRTVRSAETGDGRPDTDALVHKKPDS